MYIFDESVCLFVEFSKSMGKSTSTNHKFIREYSCQSAIRRGWSTQNFSFDACVTNVINAYMQCAKYLGYETGRFMGAGLDMDTLLERVKSQRTPNTTIISGIIHQAIFGTKLFEEPQTLHGNKETVQRK